MNPEIQKRLFNMTRGKIIGISLMSLALLLLAASAQIAYTVLNNTNIYNGVYVNNIHAGDLPVDELKTLLQTSYQDKIASTELVLKSKDKSEKIKFSDLKVSYDIQAAIDKARSVGRTGNIFERLLEVVQTARKSKKIEIPTSFDKGKVQSIIASLYDKTLINVKEVDLFIQDDKITIRSGHHGESIDKNNTFNEVSNSIKLCKGGELDIPIVKSSPSRINVDDYFKRINQQVADATIKIENNNITVVPHMIGRSIDKPALSAIASELENAENTEKVLPVIFTKPKITTQDLQAKLFKDTLATMSTQFYTGNTNDRNRGENIRLAVAKINGKLLAPGETFSFNDTVGPRTEDGGYKTAHTYVGGKIVDGIGGGICQVSTTLYNSVLFSDLDVVERTNHMFTVAYVPLGRDAAVSYGAVDFKFKNSTAWPIKLDGWVTKDNKIFFDIKGTNEQPGKTIEINPRIIKTIDFNPEPKYIDDPTLNEGTTKVEHEGMKGYIVDTYKIVKKDGKVVSETKISTSNYKTLDKEIRRGTKKVAPTGAPQPTPTPVKAVDDAGNPPVQE